MAEPTRRNLLNLAPALAMTNALQSGGAPMANGTKPNVVLIISDQFRADNLGCLGRNPMNLTPNLDAMAREGTLFRSAFASQPVCAPARATIFTGQYPEKHGIWRNAIPLDPKASTVASLLRENGYTANYVGKWHLADREKIGAVPIEARGGFRDFWEASNVLEWTSHAYGGEMFDGDGNPLRFADKYRTDFLTERAVRYLKEKRTSAPFFLTVSYLETHHQNDSDTYEPPKKYAKEYRNPFVPQDLRPLPGSWPSQLADYYGCVKGIDDAVGTLLETLKAEGLLENTIVAFTSDHGCHFKTRNTEYKRSPHDSSIHIPLIIRGPGFNGGREVKELVSQINLAPTLLEATGTAVPKQMQGESLLRLARGQTEGWRNEVYIGMREFVTARMLRTPEWAYAVAAPKKPDWKAVEGSSSYIEYMMYDMAADPFQHVNLAGRAETTKVSEELRARLRKRVVEAGDPSPEISPAWFPYV